MKNWNRFRKRLIAAASAGVLAVTGTAASVSGGFTATAADLGLDNYAKLLQYSLYFYDANMCGDGVGAQSAFSWRDDCHTGDVIPGGFHDAGDNIKCGQTAGFTASTLGWIYYEYQDEFRKTGTYQHYQVIMDEFCEFFKASTTLSGGEVTSLVYEVGDSGRDHSTWCAPEIHTSRASDEIYSTSNSGSDTAAQYAAALAQNYILNGSQEDLDYAVALYNFADKYRSVAGNGNIYGYEGVQDDISWAAGWLYLATKEDKYLTESNKHTSVTNNWTKDYCWANSWLGAAIINAEITGNWSSVTSYIGGIVNANQNQFYVMNSWGSARHNTLMQLCALVTSSHAESGVDYSEWCKKQMNMILGDNNANVCLVVGYNELSATSPHHRAASNLNISPDWHEYNNWDGSYSSTGGHTLYGALCGGPTGTDFSTYNDTAKDATSNEVALDYQIGLVGAAAGLYAAYGTGEVVESIAPEVTVYEAEIEAAGGVIVEPADAWVEVPDTIEAGEEKAVSVSSVFTHSCTWTSSDTSVLEITSDGGLTATITGISPGTVTITAQLGDGILLEHEITVTGNSVTTEATTTTQEETTTESSETTLAGEAKWSTVPDVIEELETNVLARVEGSSRVVSWESSDWEVLGVSPEGDADPDLGPTGAWLTAHKNGTATITVHFEDGTVLTHEITVAAEAYTETTETTTTEVTEETTTTTTETTAETTSSTSKVVEPGNILYGDINLDGTIDLTDAIKLNKHIAGVVQLDDNAYANADCDVNGLVTMDDAILLLQFLVHLTDHLG